MSEIINSYPKTFTVPDGAVKFKVVVHDKAIADLPAIDPQLEKGNRVSPFRPSFKDVPRAVTYIAEALQNDTTINGGLVATTLIKVGAKQVSGLWEEKAGINGAGINPATPTFWGGGNLDEAVNTVANNTGTQAPFVVTRDGRIFAYAGYIGGFQLIDEVLSTESLEMGIIDGLPQIKVRDQSQGGKEAVVIGDIPMTPVSSLSGGGNIDVVPAAVNTYTEANSRTLYVSPSGMSISSIPLSTALSLSTSYIISFSTYNMFRIGTYMREAIKSDFVSNLMVKIQVSVWDGDGVLLGSGSPIVISGNSSSAFTEYLEIKDINIQIQTKSSNTIYVKYEHLKTDIRIDDVSEYSTEFVCAIENASHIVLTSGKGSIEIGRGFQAIFGQQKYFKIEDKANIPFIQSEGIHEHNGCKTQDLLLGIYATGTTVSKWTGHRVYTAKTDFTLSKISTGLYKIVHNLQTKTAISGATDYRPVIYCGGSPSSVVTASITGNEFNFTTGADTDTIFIQIWSLKGWSL